MLKKFYLNSKEIPVPVPVKTLDEAVDWIEQTFSKKNTIITKVFLDNKDMLNSQSAERKKIQLSHASKLEVQYESPQDLSVQTLDAIRDLAHEIQKKIKNLAVATFDDANSSVRKELKDTAKDMDLILELINHLNGILDHRHHLTAAINGVNVMLRQYQKRLHNAIAEKNWQECAHLLVNRQEDLLRELARESESLQIRIYADGIEQVQSQLMCSQV